MNILNHPQIEQLKQRYQQLEKRDRLALNSLSAFLGLMLVYFMVWSPANSYVEQSRQNYQRQAALLSYLRASEAKA
ncbi:MAG: type II secretion system protein GspM, partial [Pseudomonadales bacterium]